jgi:hypothetical protein
VLAITRESDPATCYQGRVTSWQYALFLKARNSKRGQLLAMLEDTISFLGQDPDRKHRINANSFQQNALTTVNGWQYAAFYTDVFESEKAGKCHVNLARRKISPSDIPCAIGAWETLTLDDYDQSTDDGHNTISIGVCKGDGTIHIAFDHHCDL